MNFKYALKINSMYVKANTNFSTSDVELTENICLATLCNQKTQKWEDVKRHYQSEEHWYLSSVVGPSNYCSQFVRDHKDIVKLVKVYLVEEET